jgi:hypothetical protein
MLSSRNVYEAIEITDALIAARQAALAKLMATRVPLQMGKIDLQARELLAKIRKERTAVTMLRKAKRLLRSYRVGGV